MTFRPLFFLPRCVWLWAYNQAMWERLLDTPFGCLFWSADSLGIEFWYKGDIVIWTWPWRRYNRGPFISLGFSGTGEWGDARYWTLDELDREWDMYFDACKAQDRPFVVEVPFIESLYQPDPTCRGMLHGFDPKRDMRLP